MRWNMLCKRNNLHSFTFCGLKLHEDRQDSCYDCCKIFWPLRKICQQKMDIFLLSSHAFSVKSMKLDIRREMSLRCIAMSCGKWVIKIWVHFLGCTLEEAILIWEKKIYFFPLQSGRLLSTSKICDGSSLARF